MFQSLFSINIQSYSALIYIDSLYDQPWAEMVLRDKTLRHFRFITVAHLATRRDFPSQLLDKNPLKAAELASTHPFALGIDVGRFVRLSSESYGLRNVNLFACFAERLFKRSVYAYVSRIFRPVA